MTAKTSRRRPAKQPSSSGHVLALLEISDAIARVRIFGDELSGMERPELVVTALIALRDETEKVITAWTIK